MKQITETDIKIARDEHAFEMFDKPCIDRVNYQVGFMDGAKWMQSQQPEWIPISQYPKDDYLVVLRWHKLWKCIVSVVHRRAYAENGCEWLSGTKDNTWPEEAFEPFFMNLPSPPTQ